jgi:hypothetical protein
MYDVFYVSDLTKGKNKELNWIENLMYPSYWVAGGSVGVLMQSLKFFILM